MSCALPLLFPRHEQLEQYRAQLFHQLRCSNFVYANLQIYGLARLHVIRLRLQDADNIRYLGRPIGRSVGGDLRSRLGHDWASLPAGGELYRKSDVSQ